jgi:hypothetical protein
MEISEHDLLERAIQRMDEPTTSQTAMAVIPMTITFFDSLFIVWYAYDVKGTDMEATSPVVSTILSTFTFLICILGIAYRHHQKYDMVPSTFHILIRINIFHLILCGSFIPYIKSHGEYNTYMLWLYVITIPMILISLVPFVAGIYS